MRKLVGWGVGIGLMLGMAVVSQWPDGDLHVIGCEVGQGDATLVTQGFTQVLVDTGPANGMVMDCLSKNMPFWDRKIEMMVMSHPQMDHMGAMSEVMERYDIGVFLTADSVNDIEAFWELFEGVKNKGIEVVEADQGLVLRLGKMEWQVLWPVDELPDSFVWALPTESSGEYSQVLGVQQVLEVQEEDVNDESVVVKLTYDEATVLFTGDIGSKVEAELVVSGVVEDVDVLKVAHHGSRFSSTADFLEMVKPEIGLIYSGENNRYGHPNDQVISGLGAVKTTVLRTDTMGEVEVVTDGQQWWIMPE